MRIEFTNKTKEILAKRVAYFCSNPSCSKVTIGPNENKFKSISIGIAAHIFAASENGPRYNKNLSKLEICNIDNGIWLCSNCATLIDRNERKYTPEILKTWKEDAERNAEVDLISYRKRKTKKIQYDGFVFENSLDAKWAAFFKLMNWSYVYKPFEINNWSPTFQIITSNYEKFLVDVIYSINIKESIKKIALATNYSENILIVNEHPFAIKKYFKEYPNMIGLTSIKGKIEEDDQEYCSSIIYNFYDEGYSIYNLCLLNEDLHDLIEPENEFCRELWKKSQNIINQILS